MSDTPQGEGWWCASDGKYYPPESHPNYVHLPAGAPLGSPSSTASGWEWNWGTSLFTIGIVGIILGAFMPWVSVGFATANGVEGDGVITLVLGIIGGILGVIGVQRNKRTLISLSLIAMALISWVVIYDFNNIVNPDDHEIWLEPTPGTGLFLTLVAAVSGFAGTLILIKRHWRQELLST